MYHAKLKLPAEHGVMCAVERHCSAPSALTFTPAEAKTAAASLAYDRELWRASKPDNNTRNSGSKGASSTA